jgi:hypothetical protein
MAVSCVAKPSTTALSARPTSALCHVFKSTMKGYLLGEAERHQELSHLLSWRCFLKPALYNLQVGPERNPLIRCMYKYVQMHSLTIFSFHFSFPAYDLTLKWGIWYFWQTGDQVIKMQDRCIVNADPSQAPSFTGTYKMNWNCGVCTFTWNWSVMRLYMLNVASCDGFVAPTYFNFSDWLPRKDSWPQFQVLCRDARDISIFTSRYISCMIFWYSMVHKCYF